MELDYTKQGLHLFVTSLRDSIWRWPTPWDLEKKNMFIDSIIDSLVKHEMYEDIKVLTNVKKKLNT